MTDLCRMTATAASRLIRAGRLSATELMAACLDRISRRESTVRAFAYFNPTHSMARAVVRATDAGPPRRRDGSVQPRAASFFSPSFLLAVTTKPLKGLAT
jgi:Asp-tRNA(Asn)/Glu-tRNA(Gln) amidotransferase A subunit family amidase